MTTLKEWMIKEYDEETLKDMYQHGCVSGFSGLTYYSETCKVYDEYEKDIWELLEDESQCFGSKNVMEFIASFNGADQVCDDTTFKNLLVWCACEILAHQIIDY